MFNIQNQISAMSRSELYLRTIFIHNESYRPNCDMT